MKKIDFYEVLLMVFLVGLEMFPNGSIVSKFLKLFLVFITLVLNILNKKIYWSRYFNWILLMGCVAFLSYYWAYSKSLAIDGIKTVLLNSICLFSIFQLICFQGNWKKIVYQSLAVGPCMRFFYLLSIYGGEVFNGLRNIGIETGYNYVGMIAGLGIIFSILGMMYDEMYEIKSTSWAVLVVINIVIVVLSMSRKAISYFLIPLIIYYIFSNKDSLKRLKNIFILLISIYLGYLLILKIPFLYRFVGSGVEDLLGFWKNSAGDDSAAGRETRILWGLSWFYKKPLIGYGVMNYNYLFSNVEKMSDMVVADNNYIEMLVSYGVIGFILYYFIFLKTIVLSLFSINNYNKEKILALGILVSLLIGDYGSSSYIYLQNQFFLMISILLIYDGTKYTRLKVFLIR